MKIAVLSVAFYSYEFSEVFVESFKKYYAGVLPLFIVDNNMEYIKGEADIEALGFKETKYLKAKKGIRYLKNNGSNKSHGAGLDFGVKQLFLEAFDVVITVDIDSKFIGNGLLDWVVHRSLDGFKYGGRGVVKDGVGFVHPSLAFYDLQFLIGKNLSFEDESKKGALSTGQLISNTFNKFGHKPAACVRDVVIHFRLGGSVLRLGANVCKHKLLGSEKYEDSKRRFFKA